MAFTVKYVPLSPGMYNQAPQTRFPDFDSFVPLSQDLLNASKHLEDLLREISYLKAFSDEPLLHSINATSIAPQNPANPSEPVANRDFTEYLSFLQKPDTQPESSLLPETTTDDSLDFDMDTTPSEVDPDFLPWSITEDTTFDMEDSWAKSDDFSPEAASELEALFLSMDSSRLEAMQQSFEEFEREFFGEALPVPSSSNE